MIVVTKEQLQAFVVVVSKEMYPQHPWIAKNFISNQCGRRFPEQLTKEAALKRLDRLPSEYYASSEQTSFYVEYARIAEELIRWVKKLTS